VEASDAGSDAHSCFALYSDSFGRVWAGFLDGILKAYVDGSVRSFSERDGLVAHDQQHLPRTVATGSGLGRRTAERVARWRFVGISWESGLPGNIVEPIGGDDRAILVGVSSQIVRVATTALEQAIANRVSGCSTRPTTLLTGSEAIRLRSRIPIVPRTADGNALVHHQRRAGGSSIPRRVGQTRIPCSSTSSRRLPTTRCSRSRPFTAVVQTSRLQINFTALSFYQPARRSGFSYRLERIRPRLVDGAFAAGYLYETSTRQLSIPVSAMNGQIAQ